VKFDLKTVLVLLFLGFVWGSAFILMKIGAQSFDYIQMASLRLIFAGLVAVLFFIYIYKDVKIKDWKFLLLSGVLGNLIPAYLFASVSKEIPSSLSGALNALTPLFALVFGAILFKIKFNTRQFIGILIGLIGALVLIFSANSTNLEFNFQYLYPCLKVVVAALLYGINVNIIKSKLNHNDAYTNSMVPLTLISIPALFIGIGNNAFQTAIKPESLTSLLGILVLGVVGSALSLIVFNKLVKKTSALFAASVTYLIPVFAFLWGIYFKEPVGLIQVFGVSLILIGIVLTK
jgi:drug/metabolite transporter (DMT)-like permease